MVTRIGLLTLRLLNKIQEVDRGFYLHYFTF